MSQDEDLCKSNAKGEQMISRTGRLSKWMFSLTSSVLALGLSIWILPLAYAQGSMLKCKNARGQIEYRNSESMDPSCVVINKNDTRGDRYFRIGMPQHEVRDLRGEPHKSTIQVTSEGRIEAWIYEDGTSLGFRDGILVLIERSK
jgi:hypothetical protein